MPEVGRLGQPVGTFRVLLGRGADYLRTASTPARMIRRVCLAAVAVCLVTPLASAQGISSDTPLRPVTRAVAITDARVVVSPGRVLERATVLIRDGRIERVGAGLAVPFDAQHIEGDSLTVYAGFVDAFGNGGVPKPDDPERFEGDRGDPPRELAGITPDRDVRELFDVEDARIGQLRAVGFTAAHIAPRDGLFAGQGTVVLMRDLQRGEHPDAVMLTEPLSMIAQIDTAPGVYPTTPMGVLSVMRETVENTRRRGAARQAFDRSAEGASRPRYDPTLDAVQMLIDGDRQLVFVAGSWLDAFRALRASEEMGLSPILAGIPDAAPLLGRLTEAGRPMIAPLALPDTVKADSSALAVALPSTTPGGSSFVSDRRTVSYADLDNETSALTLQKRAAVAASEASPGRLAAADVTFAFGTFDVKPGDVWANLRRMIAAGLSEDDALAALTTAPAEMLGLSRELGTVEVGRLGNLVVTDGPLFSDSTAIRWVFVEGIEYEIKAADRPKPSDPNAVVQVLGTWDFEAQTPAGDQSGTFTIEGAPGSYTGSITSNGSTDPFNSVTVAGNALTVSFTNEDMGALTMTGVITDAEFAGSIAAGAFGSLPVTATRRPE